MESNVVLLKGTNENGLTTKFVASKADYDQAQKQGEVGVFSVAEMKERAVKHRDGSMSVSLFNPEDGKQEKFKLNVMA